MSKKLDWSMYSVSSYTVNEIEEMVLLTYAEWEDVVESDMAKKGWARTWQELVEKFTDYPFDLIPDSVNKAMNVYFALQEARETLKKSPLEAACAAINLSDAYMFYLHEGMVNYQRKELSKKANQIKKEKGEKLYALSLDRAMIIANNNPSWNNVQIAEEIMKEDTFKKLSLRELKSRIIRTFPDRNHRQKHK